MNNIIKPLTLEETMLKEEMKSRCLTKGQYIDEKAKDKFKMLCHLEDFEVQYYNLLDVIKELRSWLEEQYQEYKETEDERGIVLTSYAIDKLNELEGGKND